MSKLKLRDPKRKKPKKSLFERLVDIPGVYKIDINEVQQTLMSCKPGDDVSTEQPWLFIQKDVILENLEMQDETSDISRFKNEIENYPKEEILIGYDGSIDNIDQFYICLSENAVNIIMEIVENKRKKQEVKFQKCFERYCGLWSSLGSENEIDENMLKNYRPLLEINMEPTFPPVFTHETNFKLRRVEAFRDGYMEMKCIPDLINNFVKRKQVHIAVQVGIPKVPAETQTVCKYPLNVATQYCFNYEEDDKLTKPLKNYVCQNTDVIEDMLFVNTRINLYEDDFISLQSDFKPLYFVLIKEFYLYYLTVKYCTNKMVGAVSCHPIWPDIQAISYVDHSHNLYKTSKSEHKINKEVVPVLLWSTSNNLVPKLILESHREVRSLDFCPYKPNILIGGCDNGQVIIWDLQGKLLDTPREPQRKKYLTSLMGWMKNIVDDTLVRPTVVSNLQYSHKGPVVKVFWSSKYYELLNTGKFREIPPSSNRSSLQFFTASEDGTVMVWDLLKGLSLECGTVKKTKYCKNRPNTLAAASPFRIHHLNLKPTYKMSILTVDKQLLPISCASRNYDVVKVTGFDVFGRGRRESVNNTIEIIKPSSIEPVVYIGNLKGEFLQAKFSGHEFDTGELIHSENVEYNKYSDIHDGPIVSISYNSKLKSTLTVGGNILAFWCDEYHDGPLFWRKSTHLYTQVFWHRKDYFNFSACRDDGKLETWILPSQTKSFTAITPVSSVSLTETATPPDALITSKTRGIIGFGDSQGVFRFYYIPRILELEITSHLEQFQTLREREINRKQTFINWQKKWNSSHVEAAVTQKNDEKVRRKSKAATASQTDIARKQELRFSAKMNYFDFLKLKHKRDEQKHIQNVILQKTRINVKQMRTSIEPLQKLRIKNESKLQRQKVKLGNSENEFTSYAKALVPNIYEKKNDVGVDAELKHRLMEMKKKIYEDYEQICIYAQSYLESHKVTLSKKRQAVQKFENLLEYY